jgi:hypothetical protein
MLFAIARWLAIVALTATFIGFWMSSIAPVASLTSVGQTLPERRIPADDQHLKLLND